MTLEGRHERVLAIGHCNTVDYSTGFVVVGEIVGTDWSGPKQLKNQEEVNYITHCEIYTNALFY